MQLNNIYNKLTINMYTKKFNTLFQRFSYNPTNNFYNISKNSIKYKMTDNMNTLIHKSEHFSGVQKVRIFL